ncbi:unnamed protein product [Schistosoma rodhaini]|uniref:Uncharacterized protein n=2 Tax=Schistosoma rodhaini TaxID=6188 RepID=A0AA85EJQ9_9TREM|nr:unnamed protein product [Schistosoma rodhaini]
MSTDSDQEKLLQKFKDLRKEPQKQVNDLTNAINDIEENLIRNKESHSIQMQKIDQLYRTNVNDLNEEINVEDACEEFNKTVFGNEANRPVWKVSMNSKATIQHPTSYNWINEKSWLHYRKQIIESQLSTKSKDQIKCIQNKLRSREIAQRTFDRYSNRESHEVNVDEINKSKQQDELTKYPYSINHPLHIHEQQLMNKFNQLKTMQYLNLIELNTKENDLHSLLVHIRNLKFDLDNEYTKYTQMSLNEINKKKQKLINVSFLFFRFF